METKNNDKEITMDELARLMQEGLLDLKSEINKTKEDLKSDINRLESSIEEIKSDTKEIKTELHKKVDVFDHKNLEFRVEKLENKFV